MAVTVVVGSQWGDEGKGKVVDILSPEFDIVARYQGGANAGHTIKWGDTTHVLHLLPSGVFTDGVDCVIGNGVVIDVRALVDEIQDVQQLGIDLSGRLWISEHAHCILPYHQAIEKVEAAETIGTTKRGIGPAYTDKIARTGIRIGELLYPRHLSQRLNDEVKRVNTVLSRVYGRPELDAEEIIDEHVKLGKTISEYVTNTTHYLHDALKYDKQILAEGAQGSLLDIDFGTYPFVTSSSPSAGGVCTGLGIPPNAINRVIGITKAYCTRVGRGPFPTELFDGVGDHLRGVGAEFGATTGRPRRCGWLDLVALRYSCRLNGFTELVITKLDVLSGLESINICHAYENDSGTLSAFIYDINAMIDPIRPRYEVLQGWDKDIFGCKHIDDLPREAKTLINRIQKFTGVPVRLVSTGPERTQMITLAVD
ncbi:MAG: adenylosuccinate synthase [Bacteroidetes bacterium]|nr:adenylosuccinate synthase [Bacteroidota bacterium]MCY4232471.1 adenylosuccinate synthase [Bacteroidota bacterium]